MAKDTKTMGLGEIVRELINNSQVIHVLSAHDSNPRAADDLRHQHEHRQEELYGELDRRENQYRD